MKRQNKPISYVNVGGLPQNLGANKSKSLNHSTENRFLMSGGLHDQCGKVLSISVPSPCCAATHASEILIALGYPTQSGVDDGPKLDPNSGGAADFGFEG